jgi:hypothetical protein
VFLENFAQKSEISSLKSEMAALEQKQNDTT